MVPISTRFYRFYRFYRAEQCVEVLPGLTP
jgi:hypothetical protein